MRVTRLLSGRSDTERFDLYTRGSLYFLVGMEPLLALWLISDLDVESRTDIAYWLAALSLVHTAACALLLRAGLRHRLDGAPRPDGYRLVAAAVTAAGLVAVLSWAEHLDAPTPDAPGAGYFAVIGLAGYLIGTFSAGTSTRTTVMAVLAGVALVVALDVAGRLAVPDTPQGSATAISMGIAAAAVVSTFRPSVWMLEVMWELDRSQQVQARLAVAEERLRFARDLHDTLGRNLSVVAVKSQLAAQLARRRDDGAIAQMDEVREIAERALREVREVVRGYRAIDLDAELAGSQSILRAAGVSCDVSGTGSDLPPEVQATLAWVVREGITNVLRHSEATRCAIALRSGPGSVALTMENDGVNTLRRTAGGTGLIGLGERLAAVGGTLDWEDLSGGRYRLVAEVPVGAA